METIYDVVREMREIADADSQSIGRDVLRRHIQLQHFADRIKAAVKREREATCRESLQVGNAAKMREAVERLREWALMDLNENAFIADSSGNYMKFIKGTIEIVNAALSSPPRNCDLYSHDEALRIWSSLPASKENGCFDVWLLAEAKEVTERK